MDKVDKYRILGLCDTDDTPVLEDGLINILIQSIASRRSLGVLEGLVEKIWEDKAAKVAASGGHIFNGVQCAYLGHKRYDNDFVGLDLIMTDYAHYCAARAGVGQKVWLIGNAAIIVFRSPSGERQYVLGDRSTSVTNIGGKLEFPPAGFLDTQKENVFPMNEFVGGPTAYPCFDANILDEREEELGFPFESPGSLPSAKTEVIESVGMFRLPLADHVNVSHVIEMHTSAEEVYETFRSCKERSE